LPDLFLINLAYTLPGKLSKRYPGS